MPGAVDQRPGKKAAPAERVEEGGGLGTNGETDREEEHPKKQGISQPAKKYVVRADLAEGGRRIGVILGKKTPLGRCHGQPAQSAKVSAATKPYSR